MGTLELSSPTPPWDKRQLMSPILRMHRHHRCWIQFNAFRKRKPSATFLFVSLWCCWMNYGGSPSSYNKFIYKHPANCPFFSTVIQLNSLVGIYSVNPIPCLHNHRPSSHSNRHSIRVTLKRISPKKQNHSSILIPRGEKGIIFVIGLLQLSSTRKVSQQ